MPTGQVVNKPDADNGVRKSNRVSTSKGAKDKSKSTGGSFTTPWTDEPWTCNICNNLYEDQDSKLLECQRCEGRFCTKCLDKGDNEYTVLSKSNAMWFCAPCRVHIEKNINNDKMIEQKCKEIMNEFEERITTIEEALKNKCDERKVRDIIKEELASGTKGDTPQESTTTQQKATSNTQEVLTELEDRKKRENNILVFGVKEQTNNDGSERKKEDEKIIQDMLSACKLTKELLDGITKVARLGKFKKPKEESTESTEPAGIRPILVSFGTTDHKKCFFRNISELQKHDKYKSNKISNDLTKNEREKEASLREEAKRMSQEQSQSGKYVFRVRGPPWNRKIVRQTKKEN
ncbi:uncharacterized protein LOC117318912 [Pecten maximus]|uniref:uncharacterized protein LOC117318912 n=1 Tax=Pecten maximus TaxID=6579 RepID=UPI001457EF5D|nr:uncharacterized protein LOC117318912 [Pecten maximus]